MLTEKFNTHLNRLKRMAFASFANSLRLHFDAISLFFQESYPSALLLSIYSQEEFGKSLSLYYLSKDLQFKRISLQKGESIMKKKILRDHSFKQLAFGIYLPRHHSEFERIIRKSDLIEPLRRDAVFVDLKRGKYVSKPIRVVTLKKAATQIDFVNGTLLNFLYPNCDPHDDEKYTDLLDKLNRTTIRPELFFIEKILIDWDKDLTIEAYKYLQELLKENHELRLKKTYRLILQKIK